jgi:hypothetical protein
MEAKIGQFKMAIFFEREDLCTIVVEKPLPQLCRQWLEDNKEWHGLKYNAYKTQLRNSDGTIVRK